MKQLTMDDLKNPDNYKLHLVLPDPKSLSNGSDTDGNIREYYQECIRCIKSWRINGGWLKDIFVIIDYIGESLTQDQKDELISLNKVSIFSPEENEKDNGFFDVHYSGKRIRDLNLDGVITIHIDLDMILLREIPVNFFSPLIEKDLIIGGYNIEDYEYQRKPLFGNRIFNTNLVITKSKEYSFFDFYEEMIKEYSSYPDKTDYYIDETLVEKVLLNQEFNYLEQTYYEMGEGYTNNLDALPDIYFWEEHIYRNPSNNVDLKLTFYKVKKYFKQLGQIWIQ
jgi:hypothetical protein